MSQLLYCFALEIIKLQIAQVNRLRILMRVVLSSSPFCSRVFVTCLPFLLGDKQIERMVNIRHGRRTEDK